MTTPQKPKPGPRFRTSTAIRFGPELHARLVEAAEDRDLSINWLVNRAVEDFLDRLIPADEFRLTRERAPEAER